MNDGRSMPMVARAAVLLGVLAACVVAGLAPWGWIVLAGTALVLVVSLMRPRPQLAAAQQPVREVVPSPAPAAPTVSEQTWLAALPMPAIVFDADGVVLAANNAAAEFFGVVDPTRRAVESLFTHVEAVSCVREVLAASDSADTARQTLLRVARAGTPRVYRLQAGRLGEGALVLLVDETAVQTAETLKTDFVAAASHELRTPLASIKAALETLEGGALASPPMAERFLRMIRDNAERLEDLTTDLMDLSRLQRGREALRFATVSSEGLLAYLRPLYEPRLEEREVALQCEVASGAEELRTDERLLKLVLRNLVDNAVKFTERGTTVHIQAAPTSDGIRWSVRDEGPGIPLAEQPKIFERFYQVEASRRGDSRQRGTGLGLAIAKEAIDALGGRISVSSVWGQGTTMTVEVPQAASIA